MIGVFTEPPGGTPLDPAEREGLIPTHITTRDELNQLEQQNITVADVWAFSRKRDPVELDFLNNLHKRMFGDVWTWAGAKRNTERNIGVLPHLIEPELYTLIADTRCQIEHQSYDPDEIAVRFHHRLVLIHPFPNGNGRWSRLAADLLIVRLGRQRFSWGRAQLRAQGDDRAQYIAALQAADRHEINPLLVFARS